MEILTTNSVIIGAGAVGLAVSRELSHKKIENIVIEKQNEFGTITSSRNSGVIHAGIYYKTNSLKSKFCVEGNKLLYEYLSKFKVPHKNTGKILVASSIDQIEDIEKIKKQAQLNGVHKIKNISKKEISNLEPLVKGEEGLFVPSTGIIDAIAYMRSLIGEIEDCGNFISYNSSVEKIIVENNYFILIIKNTNNGEKYRLKCKKLINSAGLYASEVAKKIESLNPKYIPNTFFAKGNYFSLNKNPGINHLIYPIPEGFGLGIHLTLELDNSVKFGPDVEWVDSPNDYKVDSSRIDKFIREIKKYLPIIKRENLSSSYAGIRPITKKKDKEMRDFEISTEENHRIKNLVNLYGIESPGLTSSLSMAKHITKSII